MSLFTDGNISTFDDLQAYDSAILEISSAERLDLSAKLHVSATELGIEIEEFLRRRTGEVAAAELGQVVVTPALKQWHVLYTLSLVYGDMNGAHVNQRYESKWKQYKERATQASATLFQAGIGLVAIPLPAAAAPTLRVAGGQLAPGTYIVRVAWQNSAGESGSPSEAVAVALETEGGIAVRATKAPAGAIGYSVYAGKADEVPTKQNGAPIAPENEWVTPHAGLVVGAPLPTGQGPEWFVRHDRLLQRG
jgi:hypothetical protein